MYATTKFFTNFDVLLKYLRMQSKSTNANDYLEHYKKFLRQQLHLSEEECETVNDHFQLQSFPKNEYFITQGKVCRNMAFIAEGVMRYCMFRDDDTDVTCFLMCENDFVGDPESFFSQKPSDKNLQALTDCQLITISYDNMQKLLQQVSRGKELQAAIDHY